jgi:WD40 repeat protein
MTRWCWLAVWLLALFNPDIAVSALGAEPVASGLDRYGDPLPPGAVARLGSVRFRHPATIALLAVTPSGNEAVTLCQGSSLLRRCDLKTGKIADLHDLGAGFAAISNGRRSSLFFTDGGKRLIAVNANFLQAIDLETKAPAWKNEKTDLGQGFVACSAISRDGKWLALIQSRDGGRLLLINTETGAIKHSITRAANSPTDVVFTHNGEAVTIATHNQREGLRSWNVETGKELPVLREVPQSALSLAYSPDGKWLAVGHAQPSISLIELETRKLKHSLGGFTSSLRWVDFTSDGKSLLAYDNSGMVTVFDPEKGKKLRDFTAGQSQALPALSADGKTVITSSGNVVDAWNIETGEAVHPFEGHRSYVTHAAVSPDGRLSGTTAQDYALRLWDLQTGEQVHMRQRVPPRYGAPTVAFTPDGAHLLWANTNTSIEMLDVAVLTKQKPPPATPAPDLRGNQFATFAISDDGRTLVANNSVGGGVQIWDLSQKPADVKHVPPTFGAQSAPLAFSPDARFSATRFNVDGSGQQVVIADVTRGREVMRLVSPAGQQILDGAFAGTRLFASRSQRHVSLWDVLSGKTVVNVSTVGAAVTAVACSPDGRLLAWAESDAARTIRLYDSLNGRDVGKFTGHLGFVQCLRLHTAGERPMLLSGSHDSTTLVWDLRSIMDELRRTTPRLAEQAADHLWADLGAEDAAAMHRASWVLTAAGEESVPLLAQRLQPAPIDRALGEKIDKLVLQMDDDRFSAREQASQQAAELGEAAEPFLKESLKSTTSAEARHRVRRLLADIAGAPLVLTPDQQRTLRAVQILEQIGGSQSREILERLTQGQPSARLTQEAKNALERLEEAANERK